MKSLFDEVANNAYPGRGIVIGTSPDGTKAITGYFIMGRSENSRNRIFVEEGEGIRTEAFDPAKLEDPSLIIYAPVRVRGNDTIVTNGDQTDTVYDLMKEGKTFEQALRTREFEPERVSLRNGQLIGSLGVSVGAHSGTQQAHRGKLDGFSRLIDDFTGDLDLGERHCGAQQVHHQ